MFFRFLKFHPIFHTFTLNFANTSFQVLLKACNIVYKDIKNPKTPLKITVFQIQTHGLLFTTPRDKRLFFASDDCTEKLRKKVNHPDLSGVKSLVLPP